MHTHHTERGLSFLEQSVGKESFTSISMIQILYSHIITLPIAPLHSRAPFVLRVGQRCISPLLCIRLRSLPHLGAFELLNSRCLFGVAFSKLQIVSVTLSAGHSGLLTRGQTSQIGVAMAPVDVSGSTLQK